MLEMPFAPFVMVSPMRIGKHRRGDDESRNGENKFS